VQARGVEEARQEVTGGRRGGGGEKTREERSDPTDSSQPIPPGRALFLDRM
jgi:hypothetical protein